MKCKISLLITALTIFRLLFVGCTPQSTPTTPAEQPTQTEAPRVSEAPAETEQPQTAEAPATEALTTPSGEPIKIGFFSPTTGFAAVDGTSA